MTFMDHLTQVIASPIFPGIAMILGLFTMSVGYLAWDAVANRPRKFRGYTIKRGKSRRR